jgi:lysophospholipase L1-like esterase
VFGLLCTIVFGGAARAVLVDPSDPAILYTGRWNASNASEPWAQAKASSVIVRFEGTSIGVALDTGSQEYYRIIIDEDAASSSKTTLSSASIATLASGLPDAVHQIEIAKETDQGRWTLLGFEIDDGKSLAPPPARPNRRLVFYGDSNLAGYSLESERNQGNTNLLGSYYTYAGITARMFDAEHHNISKSGATISSLNSSFDRIDWGSNNPSWNFGNFPADAVVVNIGANDYYRQKSTNIGRYHDLLDDLRSAHPNAHIMLYNAYGWDVGEPAGYIHEVIADRADSNMSFAVFPWVFEQYHGCETDHAGMAQVLAAHLSSVMGWTAGASDVVSGFGMDGNVANGGFEARAPFGGWGWRYFDDPDVSRIHDPAGAIEGEYYLRLSDGASSQQTNPAGDGDVIDLAMWLRGADDGDQVDVTIDFRDQAAGAEIADPMQSETQTMTLSSVWQRYSMTATAPSGASKPVYSMRVTFAAGSGDSLDIDGVAVGQPTPIPIAAWVTGSLGGLLGALGARRLRPRFDQS